MGENDQCPHNSCRAEGKAFKGTRGVLAHLRQAHANEPLPAANRKKDTTLLDTLVLQSYTFDEPMDLDYINDNQGVVTERKSQKQVPPSNKCFYEETVWPAPNKRRSSNEDPIPKLSDIELLIAHFTFNSNLSKEQYKQVIDIVQMAADRVHATKQPLDLQFKTFDGLKGHLKQVGTKRSIPEPTTVSINLGDVPSFPKGKEAQFIEATGAISFTYFDIKYLTQSLFNDPLFSNLMKLSPTMAYRGDERIYTDLHNSDWWHQMQGVSPPGSVVLPLMLASDQTLVSGNQREKAWPIYLKLGNIPVEYRDKDAFDTRRLLAYLPVLNTKSLGTDEWVRTAKQSPKNYRYDCVPALTTYTADLPEQCLLTLVKYGTKVCEGCPRCYEPTVNFSNECADLHVRTPANMIQHYNDACIQMDNGREAEAKDITRKHSIHLVRNAFWNYPHHYFDIYDSITVDDLHQLGGIYKHLLEFVEKSVRQNHGKKAILEIKRRYD
ncbi:hypothetical protein BJV82DRAFT_674963 [Fennellomyces sp. T-0311]|nr:hypothetical protein BJV82DRAFT_674963 [Fennellomyces sp. T-0311]